MEKHRVPTCPFCNHEMTTDEMYKHPADLWAIAPNESSTNIECPACGEVYFCQGGYIPEYVCSKEEDE